jgi:DNA polymerase III gamma/tau subunit
MRDALSLLDVCLAYTDNEVTAQLARDVLGTAGRAAMFEFADALIDGDAGSALRQIDQVMRRGSDPQVFIRDTVAHLRGILLASAVGEGLPELMEITPEDAARFIEQSKRIGPDALNRMLELFMRAEPDTKWASRPRTILELAAVRACHPEKEPDATAWERLERVEKLVESGAAARPAKAAPRPVERADKPAEKPAPKAGPTPADIPPQAWLDALAALQEGNPSIRAPLASMRFIRFDGRQVTVEFSKKNLMHMKLLERRKSQIEAALSDAFGQPVGLALTLEGQAAKPVSDVARDVINQSYDVFGRDKIDVVE